MPESGDTRDVLLNQLADEFAARQRRGERPGVEEYCGRHPDLAADIRELFPALVELERAKQDAGHDLAVDAPPVPRLGDFRLLREVGRGGMGVVYEAEQVSLGRRVAIKLLPANVFRDPTRRRRFEREARAAAKLHHTNIVPVHGFGEHDGTPYYVMQFIPGLSLDAVIDELGRLPAGGRTPQPSGPPTGERAALSAALARSLVEPDGAGTLGWKEAGGDALTTTSAGGSTPDPAPSARPGSGSSASPGPTGVYLPGLSGPVGSLGKRTTYWESVARIGVQVAGALAYAHRLGVLHRDIKPGNLLLDLDGIVWVTDFGLAKADDSDNLTNTGDLLGTLRYMPPEAFEGKSDARSDIYALGLTLFELVALRPAYEERDRNKLVKQVTSGDPPRLRKLRKDAPRDLVTVVEKATDRDPARRYQTAGALLDDLQRFLDGRPITARRATELERLWMWARRRPAMAGLVAALFLCMLAGSAVSTVLAVRADGFARDAESREQEARGARDVASRSAAEAKRQEGEAIKARAVSEELRTAAQAETYRHLFSEATALRQGHQPGWRSMALADLTRVAVMPTHRRNPHELRTEATAALATPDIELSAKIALPSTDPGSLAFSPDGRTLVTAGPGTGIDFWDVRGNRHLSSAAGLAVSKSGADRAVYLPDGQGLAVATSDQGVVFTDLKGARIPRAPITQGSSQPSKLAICANGQRIAVGWAGAGITVHDLAGGTLLLKSKGSHFALSPDGRWLARLENDELVMIPVGSEEQRVVLGRHEGVGANALAFNTDGTKLAVAFYKKTPDAVEPGDLADPGRVVVWDVVKREQFCTLRGHRERILDLAFSPDGEWLATGSLDYSARIWDVRTGQHVATLPVASSPANRVQWSPTGDRLAVCLNNPRQIFLYAIAGRHGVQQWLTGHRVELRCVAAHPRLDRLATSGYSELNAWDLSGPRPARIAFEPNPGAVTAMAYSPDGSMLATASWRGSKPGDVVILTRDANSGQVRGRFAGSNLVNALAFDPTAERLACGDAAGKVVVCDLATGKRVQQFDTGSEVSSVVFLDQPRRLVTHGKDSVLIFNLESGALERKVEIPGESVRQFVADRARRRLILGFKSGALAGLSLPDLTPGLRLEHAHDSKVRCLALSPDGRLLASGSDHHIVLHDAASFEPLLDFPSWAGTLRDMTFDSTGRRLAIVGTGNEVDLWDLAALRDGLTAVGLAWDQPAPAAVLASSPPPEGEPTRPLVPVIRRPG
jgi:WD40 repeat protein